jgi:hypothetical protein
MEQQRRRDALTEQQRRDEYQNRRDAMTEQQRQNQLARNAMEQQRHRDTLTEQQRQFNIVLLLLVKKLFKLFYKFVMSRAH